MTADMIGLEIYRMIVPGNKLESPYSPYARASYGPAINLEQNLLQSPSQMPAFAPYGNTVNTPALQAGALPASGYGQPALSNKPAAQSATAIAGAPKLSPPTQSPLDKASLSVDRSPAARTIASPSQNKWLLAGLTALSAIPLIFLLVRENQFSKLKTTLTKVESEKSSLLTSNTDLTTSLNQSKKEVKNLKEASLQQKEQGPAYQRLKDEYTALGNTVTQLKRDNLTLRAESERLRANNQSLTNEAERLRTSHSTLMTEAGQLRTNNGRLTNEAVRLRRDNTILTAEAARLREQLSSNIRRAPLRLEEDGLPEVARTKLADIRTLLRTNPHELEGVSVNSQRAGEDVEVCFLFAGSDNFPGPLRAAYEADDGAFQLFLPRSQVTAQARRNKENLAAFLRMPAFPDNIHFQSR